MKKLICAVMMLAATSAFANDEKEQRCQLYVQAGIYGATQMLRGSTREIVYINRNQLIELIEHGLGSDRIYFFRDPSVPDEERDFTEAAAYRGFDLMKKWKAANGDALPKESEWEASLYAECMAKEGA